MLARARAKAAESLERLREVNGLQDGKSSMQVAAPESSSLKVPADSKLLSCAWLNRRFKIRYGRCLVLGPRLERTLRVHSTNVEPVVLRFREFETCSF